MVGLRRYKEAEELFRKGLEIQPQASRFHSYLALLDLVQNRPTQAMTNARLETEVSGATMQSLWCSKRRTTELWPMLR